MSRSGFATKRAAQEALREVLARQNAEIAEVHRLRVDVYLEQWLAGKRSIRAGTKRGYDSHVRLYLAPHLGRVLLADLRPHHLDVMYADLLDSATRSTATVRRIHATLRSALNAAVKRRLIPWNPALHVELPSAEWVATSVWTPQQLGRFLDHVASHRLYGLFHLLAMSGLRRGEVLGLRWVDLDLDIGVLRVAQQLVDSPGQPEFGPTKSRSGTRSIALDPDTVKVLRNHRTRQQAERAKWGEAWVDRGLVFTKENGDLLRPDYLSHLFIKLTTNAGMTRIRLHDLRHTSASLALAAGVPMKVVSERLGHSSMTITADLYTHVVPAVARDAADRIAATVPRQPRTTPEPKYCEITASDLRSDPSKGDS